MIDAVASAGFTKKFTTPSHWVTATISNSAEAAAYQRWTAEAITLYFGLFMRTPDSGGVAYWSGVLASGQWQRTILAYLTSVEYRNAC